MNEEVTAQVTGCAQKLLTTMGFTEAKVTGTESDENIQLNIDAGPHGRLLIGAHGAHLAALQHILRLIVRRTSAPLLSVTADVNGYRAGREKTLQHMAQEAVRQAQRTGRAIVLPPMVSLERRMIHTALATRQDIRTESLGEEPNRRVVVRPTVI